MPSFLSIALIGFAGVVGACGFAPSSAPTSTSPSAPASVTALASRTAGPSSPIDWATLARTLQLPHLAAGQTCPRSSGRQISAAFGAALGDGPVYPVLGSSDIGLERSAADGPYRAKVLWVSSSSYLGPVLIRGAQLDGPGVVEFAVGDSTSTAELRLREATATSDGEEPGWREWPSYTDVAGSGCYAYQVDGSFGTAIIVFSADVAK